MAEADAPHPLAARYDTLWNDAAPEVRQGRLTLDPWAVRKEADARRGVTLLARPEPAVADRLVAFVDELRAREPGQYYQPRRDLHFTVLSLFTATAEFQPYLAQLELYQAAVEEAVTGAAPFAVLLRGVTLSPGAVLAQGFPQDDTLAGLRERLRAALAARGLGRALDERYRLATAHMTIGRFVSPLRDPRRFVDALDAARERAFGRSVVTRLELVFHDWYQSSEHERPIAAYDLTV